MNLRGLFFLVVAVKGTAVASLLHLVGGVLGAPAGWHDWLHRRWSRLLLRAAGVEVELAGAEHLRPEAPRVLACNHQSMFDILALMAVVPGTVRFVAKAELADVPLFAAGMRAGGHVFVERENPRRAISAMRDVAARMRDEGFSVAVFPEGTRSPDGRLRRFKRAPFLLAIEADVPVVPVAVDGGHRVLPRGELRPRPGRMSVRAGEAIGAGELATGDRADLARRVHDHVDSLLEETRSGD